MQRSLPFGPALRRRRLAAGLSLSQLSQRVHYSKAQLSKVERGLKPASADLARLCDATLEAGGELTSLLPGDADGTELPITKDEEQEEEVWLMHLSANGPSWFRPMDRRSVMSTGAAGAAAFVGLGTGPARSATAHGGDPAGLTLLESARALFDQYRCLGQTARPEVVLPALIAQTHSLRELSARTGPRSRNALLRLASRYAEYVGWLVQETGNDRGALWWTDRAVELASEGGDTDLAAYAVVRRGLITLYRRDGRQTVQLARQAQSGALPPRIRGLALQREGQGHAMTGEHAASMRCLDRARELLARDQADGSAPVLGTSTVRDPISLATAWCLYDLGRPQRAARILEREVRHIPRHALRARTRFGARLALAYASAGEIDRACALAHDLVEATGAIESATVRTDIVRLSEVLTRYHNSDAVRAFAPQLTAFLATSGQAENH